MEMLALLMLGVGALLALDVFGSDETDQDADATFDPSDLPEAPDGYRVWLHETDGQPGNVGLEDDFSNTVFEATEGDDVILIDDFPTDATTIFGGGGDDIINAPVAYNIGLFGGSGDDFIALSGDALSGSGYDIYADAGEGDDTIAYTAWVDPVNYVDDLFATPLSGGEGADTFQIDLSYGGPEHTYNRMPLDAPPDKIIGIVGAEPGVDDVVIDFSLEDDAPVSFVEMDLVKDLEAERAHLVITMQLESGVHQDDSSGEYYLDGYNYDVFLEFGDPDTNWDDLTLTGDVPPLASE